EGRFLAFVRGGSQQEGVPDDTVVRLPVYPEQPRGADVVLQVLELALLVDPERDLRTPGLDVDIDRLDVPANRRLHILKAGEGPFRGLDRRIGRQESPRDWVLHSPSGARVRALAIDSAVSESLVSQIHSTSMVPTFLS